MFALNGRQEPLALAGPERRAYEIDWRSSDFDLSLSFVEREGGLAGTIEYATALFDGDTIARAAEHLVVLLAAMVEQPEQRVDRPAIMRPEEQRRVVFAWNMPLVQLDQRAALCAHQLFERARGGHRTRLRLLAPSAR